MIKLTYCLVRKEELSREAFQDYWLNKHAPLVKSHAKVLKIARYVQLHTGDAAMSEVLRASRVNGKLENAPEVFDGVAQLWWNTLDDLMAGQTDPQAQAAGQELLEDEAKFIDFARSPLWFGEEHVIIG